MKYQGLKLEHTNDNYSRKIKDTEKDFMPQKGSSDEVARKAEKLSGDYTRVIDRPDYKEPEEYAEMVNS